MKAVLRVQSDHWLIAGVSVEFVQKMSIMRMIDINAEPILNANRQVRIRIQIGTCYLLLLSLPLGSEIILPRP